MVLLSHKIYMTALLKTEMLPLTLAICIYKLIYLQLRSVHSFCFFCAFKLFTAHKAHKPSLADCQVHSTSFTGVIKYMFKYIIDRNKPCCSLPTTLHDFAVCLHYVTERFSGLLKTQCVHKIRFKTLNLFYGLLC